MTWAEGSPRYQGRLESLDTSFRDVRCWYSASTPSCYMIVCRPLLHGLMIIPIIVPFSIFLNLSGIYLMKVIFL